MSTTCISMLRITSLSNRLFFILFLSLFSYPEDLLGRITIDSIYSYTCIDQPKEAIPIANKQLPVATVASKNRHQSFPFFTTNPTAQAGQFNFFIEGDMTSINGDIEGPGAIGGDLTLDGSNTMASNQAGNFQVAGDSQPTGLVVGGRLYYTSGSGLNVNQNTYVKIGDGTGSTVYSTNGGTSVLTQVTGGAYNAQPRISLQISQPASSVIAADLIDFEAIFDDFSCYSDGMEKLIDNTAYELTNSDKGTIPLNANTLNVVTVTAAQLNAIQDLDIGSNNSINVSASNPLIINIDAPGTFNWNVPNFGKASDADSKYIILNFYNSTTVNLTGNGTIKGTVFAPLAQVNKSTSGNVNGQLIAKSYTHTSGELHQHPFSPTFTIPACTPICKPKICLPVTAVIRRGKRN